MKRRLWRGALFALVAPTLALGAWGSGGKPPPPLPPPPPLLTSHISRVVVIAMENQELSDVIGTPDAQYPNRLARRYGLATSYYAVAHPSLPNYLALTGGSTFGIDTDCTSCS